MGGIGFDRRVMAVAVVVAAAVIGGGYIRGAQTEMTNTDKAQMTSATTQPVAPALNFTLKDIDGQDVPLSRYQGKTILMVNVASKCGNTPQYKGLEEMYTKYKDQGFVILGFPANNFGGQEPGTETQIKEFCTLTYHVNFPMFSKISVKGDDIAPLYAHLISQATAPQAKGDITWNFEKFLIGRDGSVIARFAPKTKPTEPEVIKAIEADLAKAKP